MHIFLTDKYDLKADSGFFKGLLRLVVKQSTQG